MLVKIMELKEGKKKNSKTNLSQICATYNLVILNKGII